MGRPKVFFVVVQPAGMVDLYPGHGAPFANDARELRETFDVPVLEDADLVSRQPPPRGKSPWPRPPCHRGRSILRNAPCLPR